MKGSSVATNGVGEPFWLEALHQPASGFDRSLRPEWLCGVTGCHRGPRERIARADRTRTSSVAARIFTTRARSGEPLGALRTSLFALAREASRRVLGERPFDEQVVAALALDAGHVVEMQTGEGKTLAAVMPAALNAFADRGVHVLTFNDYLARRDAEWMGPVYRMLGLSVGYIQQGMPPGARRAAYNADITYVTAKEAGFDHLRDLLAMDAADLVHRPFHFALVDEADSLMIDEARVPLVIAGSVEREDVPRAAAGGARRVSLAGRSLRHRRIRAGHRADRSRRRARRADPRLRQPSRARRTSRS